MRELRDRVGLGWRPAIAGSILAVADQLDLVEVILDDWLGAPPERLRALRTLSARLPVALHGVGLGLASAAPVEQGRLDALARLVEAVRPEGWSEHLAFVRAGDVEIGHLAAPPRTLASLEGAARNLRRARATVGSTPLLENVATLLEPPGSRIPEPEWLGIALQACEAPLLLDLHNWWANAVNFGWDPLAGLAALPLERLEQVHLAGGRWIGRVLDDHLHAVPEPVFALLEEVAARAPGPLTVIVERDGRYPPMEELLGELGEARARLARGRARRVAREGRAAPAPSGAPPDLSAAAALERLLARAYVDPAARASLLEDPELAAERAGAAGLLAGIRLDVEGLAMAAESFRRKRERHAH